jgi:hypothetical protein
MAPNFLASPDDAFQLDHPAKDVCVLSEDMGVVLKARGFGLRGVQPPSELRLKPEPSDEERRIQELEARIADLEMGSPIVTLASQNNPTEVSVNAAGRGPVRSRRPDENMVELLNGMEE